jgi:hypothetical protein
VFWVRLGSSVLAWLFCAGLAWPVLGSYVLFLSGLFSAAILWLGLVVLG